MTLLLDGSPIPFEYPTHRGDPYPGFSADLDTTVLTNGSHTLTLHSVSQTGFSKDVSVRYFIVNNAFDTTNGAIDFPAEGDVVSGITNVSGWAGDGQNYGLTVGQMILLLDGAPIPFTYPTERDGDIYAGFETSIDTAELANGPHTLTLHTISRTGYAKDIDIQHFTVSNSIVGPPVLLGDLNGDGKVNVQDANLSLRIAIGLHSPTDAQTAVGDMNQDGHLNVQDTTMILLAIVSALK
jgi:hypothetical protein